MRIPKSLETLADHGVIEEVVRPLMSGKEAQTYLVIAEGRKCVAKIYKDAQSRSFKNRADYVEGRRVRNSRDQRAISKRTKYGKGKDEDTWKSTEVDMIYRMQAAGVPVPAPLTFIDGVFLMELVTDADGNPAPRLGDLEFSPEEALGIHEVLIEAVTKMLCAGVVHGDFSEFNVLLGAHGPVVIDFPQAVSAAGNRNARSLLIRDVGNLNRFLARWVPGAKKLAYAEEMWALYENNSLTADTRLTGHFKQARGPVDTTAVLELIGDANRDEARRRRSLGESTAGLGVEEDRPAPRRREVVVERPARRGGARRPSMSAAGSRWGGGSQDRDRGRGEERRAGAEKRGPPKAKARPKRGENVQASTYVSPEARKTKVQPLTPRNGSGGAPRPSSSHSEGRRGPGNAEASGRPRRRRPRRR